MQVGDCFTLRNKKMGFIALVFQYVIEATVLCIGKKASAANGGERANTTAPAIPGRWRMCDCNNLSTRIVWDENRSILGVMSLNKLL